MIYQMLTLQAFDKLLGSFVTAERRFKSCHQLSTDTFKLNTADPSLGMFAIAHLFPECIVLERYIRLLHD